MMKERRHLRPLLLKFGVAGALSFAGFLYSQIRSRNIKPSSPHPRSLSVSDGVIEADIGGRDGYKDDVQCLKISPTSDSEEMCVEQISVDNASVDLSSVRHDGDGFLLPEYNDVVEEYELSVTAAGSSPTKEVEAPTVDVDVDVDTSRTFRNAEKDDYEQQIEHLRNMVNMLRDRVRNLEVQLLEYYGLKEQEAAVLELQNRLKINNMEVKLFTVKIESLQSENQRLKGQVGYHAKIVADLEAARFKIKLLKKKLRDETEQKREQILSLQQRVARLQEEEQDIESKLQRLQVLEGEAEELRKSNRILQIENSELARKLDSTKLLANSDLEDPETETVNEVSTCLKQENEELRKQIEELQANRCADVEELVYLRWINACLRYELRNFQPPAGKTVARDLSRSLSPKSEEKAKKLILEYAQSEGMGDAWMHSLDFDCDQWSSSSQASVTDTGELGLDDSSFDNTSTTRSNSSGKKKFFSNLRKLLTGKESRHHSQASTMCKTDQSVADSLMWAPSTGDDPFAMLMLRSHSCRVITPSPSPLDVPRERGRSMSVDHIKEAVNLRGNSDCDSHRCRNDPSDPLKSDLVKFAQVLKESKPRRAHRKSASII